MKNYRTLVRLDKVPKKLPKLAKRPSKPFLINCVLGELSLELYANQEPGFADIVGSAQSSAGTTGDQKKEKSTSEPTPSFLPLFLWKLDGLQLSAMLCGPRRAIYFTLDNFTLQGWLFIGWTTSCKSYLPSVFVTLFVLFSYHF